MRLSILIPVFNEESTISRVLSKVEKVNIPWKKEIIVINDGSTDGTAKILSTYAKTVSKNNIRIITHPTNRGKGVALQSGIKKVSGDYILIQDADLEYDPEEIPLLIGEVKNNPEAAVYGSRLMKKNPVMPLLYILGNRFLTFMTNFLCQTTLTDMETGYKLLPTRAAKRMQLKSSRFDIEPEITVQLVKLGIPIVEVPISYRGRSHLAGKKLTLKDAYSALFALLYFRFRP